jgi:hypothetical protein
MDRPWCCNGARCIEYGRKPAASDTASRRRAGGRAVGLTLNAYSHAVPPLEEEAATKIAALLFSV